MTLESAPASDSDRIVSAKSPDCFREVIVQADHLSSTHTVEREVLVWDHGQLGVAILRQWGLFEEIQAVARYHHEADQQLENPRD